MHVSKQRLNFNLKAVDARSDAQSWSPFTRGMLSDMTDRRMTPLSYRGFIVACTVLRLSPYCGP